jgi:hypothetical protein
MRQIAEGVARPVTKSKPWSRDFDPDLASEIIDRIASGESLGQIVRLPGMPRRSVIFHWLAVEEEFAKEWQWAMQAGGLARGDDVAEIADLALRELRHNDFDPKAATIAMNASTWLAERMAPNVYNAKSVVELSGKGGAPLQITFTPTDADLC